MASLAADPMWNRSDRKSEVHEQNERIPGERHDLDKRTLQARKRSSVWPSDFLSVGWLPWWEFHCGSSRRTTTRAGPTGLQLAVPEPSTCEAGGEGRVSRRDRLGGVNPRTTGKRQTPDKCPPPGSIDAPQGNLRFLARQGTLS